MIELGDTELCLSVPAGGSLQLDYLWLRDNCPSAFHPHTRERNFDLLSVAEDIRPRHAGIEDGALLIEWSGEPSHVSRYPASMVDGWISARRAAASGLEPTASCRTWATDFAPRIFAASVLLDDDAALLHWLDELVATGLTLVTGLDEDADAGLRIAERIAFVRRTNFGTTFDVRHVPEPDNQAYTAEALPLHTDLANQELPPGYQFLHSVVNDAAGGESRFVDGFQVAQDLASAHRGHFDTLTSTPVPFRFHDNDTDLRAHRPIIRCESDGRVCEISYNAHLADTFDLPAADMRSYYLAYREWMRRLRDARYAVGFRLSAGSMVVFDNRRILHGRGMFDPASGARHFRGCYVDRGDVAGRQRALRSRLAID